MLTCSFIVLQCTGNVDKTVKLWKVFEKSIKVVAENNHSSGQRVPNGSLQLPKLTHHDSIVAAVPRKVYANAHAYHINSISINSDAETYISADDLRINLWNLDISDQSFSKWALVVSTRTVMKPCIDTSFAPPCVSFSISPPRHCRHQASQHGGADRSYHCCRIPPSSLQLVYVQQQQRNHQVERHERICSL